MNSTKQKSTTMTATKMLLLLTDIFKSDAMRLSWSPTLT